MAYFSNSSDGFVLDEQCSDCIHEDPEAGCPVALAHFLLNYDQVGNTDLTKCLNMLVDDKRGECKMKPLIEKYYKKIPLESKETSTENVQYLGPEWAPIKPLTP